MKLARSHLVAALAVVTVALLAGRARAETRSPYLAPIRLVVDRFLEEHGEALGHRALEAARKIQAALADDGDDPVTQIRLLHKVAKHWKRLGDGAPAGLLVDALAGFEAEIDAAIVAGESVQLEEKASSPARAGRKAKTWLAKARRILEKARAARTAASAAGKAAKAAGKVRQALALFGKVTNVVVYEWAHCDSVGWAGTPYVRGLNCRLVLVDGYPRRYVVYVPTTGPWSESESAPALMMLHGTGGTGERFYRSSGWKEKADEVGLVAAFPTGLVYNVPEDGFRETKWNKFRLVDEIDVSDLPPGYPTGAPWPADDVGFMRSILDDLEANLMIDADHLYASGFSNGAAMTGRLAYELSDRLAAVAYGSSIVSGAPAPPLRKIPILNTLGSEDDGFQEKFGLTPEEPIPLDPATFLAFPQVQFGFGEILDDFELEYDPHDELENPHSTAYRLATPKAGNAAGNGFAFVLMEGLIHHYPVGPLHPEWNPYGFNAPDLYWDFFVETTWP